MTERSAIAIAAHPDDIEFMMAGTLYLLREAGYRTHYLNLSSGSCGSTVRSPAATRTLRRREAQRSAALLGAKFHASRTDDYEILYTLPLLRWLTGVIREVRPTIVLTHSPQDYLEDHMNTSRLAVSAAFARAMPNFADGRRRGVWSGDVTLYHGMPHGLRDGLRRRVIPGAFVDTSSVQAEKTAALACHASQRDWLRETQGFDSYLAAMDAMSREVGKMSGRFKIAEGWRRHSHLGYSETDVDPLAEALGEKYHVNPDYEHSVDRGEPVGA